MWHALRLRSFSTIRSSAVLALVLALGVAVGCDDDDTTGVMGPFQLTFQLDDTYQTPHGGQSIRFAVVRSSDGMVVARGSGTVSATADPAFSVTTQAVLESGVDYRLHYWIDSNFGGGTDGVCDPIVNDHQWNRAVPTPMGDVTITETHEPQEVQNVCPTFTAELMFAGDATFQTPHGGQTVTVGVVRASDGMVVHTASGTVSDVDDPAFSFSFPGLLVIGVEYEVHYWIDSNFMGGTVGTCDAPEDDHQWRVTVPTVQDDVAITETHDPNAVTDVCSTFN